MNPQPVTQAMVVARALQGRGLELTSYPPSTRRTVSFSINKANRKSWECHERSPSPWRTRSRAQKEMIPLVIFCEAVKVRSPRQRGNSAQRVGLYRPSDSGHAS